ncbi:MAG: FHA domain-containing protein [Desulfobacteraceae bacterium]|nr:FHA domain-containing protein [Desulfobacteraceae bacterium]
MPEWIISLQDRVIKRFLIDEGHRLTIGRSGEADVTIDNTAVSRLHSAFSLRNGIYFLEDLNSLNGTFINGRRIEAETPVSPEDEIAIGKFRLGAAAEGDQREESASVVAAAMDLDDATVFVTPKARAASEPASPPGKTGTCRLTVIDGSAVPRELALDGRSSIKIGKDADADIRVPGWLVAPAQCFVVDQAGRFVIAPQKSWTGTWLNGLRIKDPQPLRKGDVITIGRVKIRYE